MSQPIDDDYLTSFALEQQRRPLGAADGHMPRCDYCRPHHFHGLRCRAPGGMCTCPTSYRPEETA